jgi:predicted ferric reductase
MPLGTEVRIVGPFGSLTLRHNAARPAVFLAGGIGIGCGSFRTTAIPQKIEDFAEFSNF